MKPLEFKSRNVGLEVCSVCPEQKAAVDVGGFEISRGNNVACCLLVQVQLALTACGRPTHHLLQVRKAGSVSRQTPRPPAPFRLRTLHLFRWDGAVLGFQEILLCLKSKGIWRIVQSCLLWGKKVSMSSKCNRKQILGSEKHEIHKQEVTQKQSQLIEDKSKIHQKR